MFSLAGWLFFACVSAPAADVPYLSGRVVDHAEILSASTRQALGDTLKAHEEQTTNQIVVLTIPSLDGDSVEGYATRVFEAWKLGQQGKDNGVLLIVSSKDRRLRIEVGYGLEGQLPDVVAACIIRDTITPRFKAGDYDKGVADGIEAVIAQLEGRTAASAPEPVAGNEGTGKSAKAFDIDVPDLPWPMRILMGAFIFGIIGLFTVIGVMTPGVGWFLYLFLIPFWAMFPIIIVGTRGALALLVTYLIAYPAAKLFLRNKPWYTKAAKQLRSKGTASIGGFTVTTGGSSSRSSGGFSGGGGSSGGGGASGSW